MRGMDIDIAGALWYLFRVGCCIGILVGVTLSLIVWSLT